MFTDIQCLGVVTASKNNLTSVFLFLQSIIHQSPNVELFSNTSTNKKVPHFRDKTVIDMSIIPVLSKAMFNIKGACVLRSPRNILGVSVLCFSVHSFHVKEGFREIYANCNSSGAFCLFFVARL